MAKREDSALDENASVNNSEQQLLAAATQIETFEKTPDLEVEDEKIRLVQKLVELQSQDDIASGQLEQLALQNDKLKRMIEEKQQLLNVEA